MHLVVVRATDYVGRALRDGGGNREAATAANGAVLIAARTLAIDEGSHDARELDAGIGTILVGVHVLARAIGLPLVGAVQVEVYLLASTECVAPGDAHLHRRAHAPDGAAHGIGLEVEVVGLVEGADKLGVERVASARCHLQVYGAEDALGIELLHRLLIVVEAEQIAMTQLHVAQHHTRTQGRRLATIAVGGVAAHQRVGGLLAGRAAERHIDTPHIPGSQGQRGHRVDHLQAQLRTIGQLERVGQIGRVARRIVVIAVVAEELREPRALGIEGSHAEGCTFLYIGVAPSGVYERLHVGREAHVGHRVDRCHRIDYDRIANLRLLRVLLRHLRVADAPTEVAVLAQYRLRHRGSQGRVHLAHQYGSLAKGLTQPLLELAVRAVGVVPYPQTVGERRAIVGRAEERTVGCRCQCSLYLLLGGNEVVVLLIVLIVNLRQPDEQLVVVGNVLGRGAGKLHRTAKNKYEVSIVSSHCVQFLLCHVASSSCWRALSAAGWSAGLWPTP